MEKSESIKCKKNRSAHKKPNTPQPSIWSCITNVSKWSDIIKPSAKPNKNQNVPKKKSNHKKQKERSQTKTKKVTPPPPPPTTKTNTCTYRATKHQTAEFQNNVYQPCKDTDCTTKRKFTLLENSTGCKQFQNQLHKTCSQEIKKKFKIENQHVNWYKIVTAQDYYDTKENLIPNAKNTNKQPETKRKKDKKVRIIALLIEKIKKLETQIRDLQFLNLRKKGQEIETIKNLIPPKLSEDKVKKFKDLQEVSKKEDKPLAEKTGFKSEKCQIPKIKPDKSRQSKIGAQAREKERTKRKRNQQAIKNTNNEQTKNRNQIKESFIKSHNKMKGLPEDMKFNIGAAMSRKMIHYGTGSPQKNQTDEKDIKEEKKTIWFLIDRIKHLESQFKMLDKSTINSSKSSSIPYLRKKNNLAEEIRKEIKRQNQLKINMNQQNPEYYQKNIRYEKCYPNFQPRKTLSQKPRDIEIQKINLLESQQRLNKIVKKQKENTFKVMQEKLTQTSQLNLMLAPKSDIPKENQDDVSTTEESNTCSINSQGNSNNQVNIQGTDTLRTKSLKQPDLEKNKRSDIISENCDITRSNQETATTSTDKSEIKNVDCKNEMTADRITPELLIRSDETTETINNNYKNEVAIDHVRSKILDENSSYESELKKMFKKNLIDIKNFIQDEINKKETNDNNNKAKLNSSNQNIKQTNKNSLNNSTKNQNSDANRTIKTQTGRYSLFKQKGYITAKERRSFDESERRIYESLKIGNNNNNIDSTRINDKKSLIQIKISSKERKPNNTSPVEFQDVTIRKGTRFNIPSSQTTGSSMSSYSSIHGDNQRIIPKIFLTEQNLQNNTQIYSKEEEAVKHGLAKSEPTSSPIKEHPLNWYNDENLINQEFKWKSITSFPSLSNNHLKEMKGDNSDNREINSTIINRNFGFSSTQKYGVQSENDSDVLMNVIQLKPPQIPIENVNNIYLVLVNDEKNEVPKEIGEDKIREMVSNFRNSIDQLIKQEIEVIKPNSLENKNQCDMKKNKENINNETNTNYLCTSEKIITTKNKESDSCITVQENEGSYTNTVTDLNTNIKQNENPTPSIENPTDINEIPQDIISPSKNLITDISKCQCTMTGTNVCFPPLNYIDYSMSFSQSSGSGTNKSSMSSEKKILKPNSNSNLIVKLQKEIELQKREVNELKSIWSHCSSRLENIWRTNKQQAIDFHQRKLITSDEEKFISTFIKPIDRKLLIKTPNNTKRKEFIPYLQMKSHYKKSPNDFNKIPKSKILNRNANSKMNNTYENATSDNLSEITTEAGSDKKTSLTRMTSTYLLRKKHRSQGNSNLKHTFDSSSFRNYTTDPSTESYSCITYSEFSDNSRWRTIERGTQTIKGGKTKHENIIKQTKTDKMKCVTFDRNNNTINMNGEKLIIEAVRKNNKILVKEIKTE